MARDDLFEQEEERMPRMTFGEHLEDLRRRLILALFGFLPGVILGFLVGKTIIQAMIIPVEAAVLEYRADRRAERMIDLEKKRLDDHQGNPTKSEQLTFRIGKKTIRDLIRQAIPELPIEENPAASDGSVTLKVEIQREELEIAAEPRMNPSTLQALKPQEVFMSWMMVSLVTGLVISSPWVIFQIWAFVAEGLYGHERRVVYRAMPLSIGLFLGGVLFCFIIVLPVVIRFFFGFNAWLEIEPNIRLTEWLGFATMLPLIFGVCFELPLVMLVLETVGIFTVDDFISKWRHAILTIAIVAMIVTPTTDPGSMMLLMAPMAGLYWSGIGLIRIRHARARGVAAFGPKAKLFLVVGALAGIYASVLMSGFFVGFLVAPEAWFEHVWKVAAMPTSHFLQKYHPELNVAELGWITLSTLVNAGIGGLVFYRLGELYLRFVKRGDRS